MCVCVCVCVCLCLPRQDNTIIQNDISLFLCYIILYTQIFSTVSRSVTVLRY